MNHKYLKYLLVLIAAMTFAFKPAKQNVQDDPDKAFSGFEDRFLDAYWKQHPAASIFVGYGKYYDQLVIPGSASYASDMAFSKRWLDSLNKMDISRLSDNNKISLNIIRNQLQSDIWYQSVFGQQEWDASLYNLSGECDYIINQPYAPLDERLLTLSKRLQHADEFYKAALSILRKPTKEHVQMAIRQNQGGLSVFGTSLTDSIKASRLSDAEKLRLQQNVEKTIKSVNTYTDGLKAMVADKNYVFRSFRIGKELFAQKFKYDLATDFSPEEMYAKAMADKKMYQQKMAKLASGFFGGGML